MDGPWVVYFQNCVVATVLQEQFGTCNDHLNLQCLRLMIHVCTDHKQVQELHLKNQLLLTMTFQQRRQDKVTVSISATHTYCIYNRKRGQLEPLKLDMKVLIS
jgi:hypothetical protein